MDNLDIATLCLINKGNISGGRMAEYLNVTRKQQYNRLRRLVTGGFVNPNKPQQKCTYTLTDAGYEIAKSYTIFFNPFRLGHIEKYEIEA